MTTNFQERSLKPWHKALLRLTLPIIYIFLIGCTVCTIVFLGPLCGIAASISWVISGDAYSEYTITPAIFPLGVAFVYCDWLKENEVIKS